MNEFKQNLKRVILIAGDIILFYFSLLLSLKLRLGPDYTHVILTQHIFPFSVIFMLWITVFYISNLYSMDYARNTYGFYSYVLKSFLVNFIIAIIFFYIAYSQKGISPKTILLLYFLIFSILFIAWRILYNYFIKTRAFIINTIILSDNEEAKEITAKIKENPQLGYGIIDYSENDLKNLQKFIQEKNIKLIITSEEIRSDPALINDLYESLSLKIKFENLLNFYEEIMGKIPLSIIEKIWFLENIKNLDKPLYNMLKRIIDEIISVIALTLTLPLFPLVILAIKLESRGPAFIIQKRSGQNGRMFNNIKFRSMTVDDDGKWPEENDKRITRCGKFLRKTRIDELPQLINVIMGNLSLVGPRPDMIELYKRLASEIPYYNIRNIIKPGLTGWAQTHQEIPPHSVETTKQRLAYDFYYLKNKSLLLDLIIILKTIKTLISRTGK